jgi:hypothetical protein
MGGVFLRGNFANFGLGFHASGAGFYALAAFASGPLQIRLQPNNRCAHGVASFYSAGIGFAANCTHSWHSRKSKLQISNFK